MTDMTDNPLRALDRWHFKTVENGPFSGNTFPERVPDGEWVKWSDLQNGAFYEALIRDKAAPAQDAVVIGFVCPNEVAQLADGVGAAFLYPKQIAGTIPAYTTPPTPSGNAALEEAYRHATMLIQYAHDQGFHEMGYRPEKVLYDAAIAALTSPTWKVVAWMRDSGVPTEKEPAVISNVIRDLWLKANPKAVERYTIPLVKQLRALACQAQAAQPNVALVEIGQFNEIDDGLGTSFCEWNQERYRQPNGTKVYVLATQPQAQEAGRGEPYPSEDHECAYENGDGRCRECSDLAKRAAELDAQQKPASSELERLQAILARPAHQHLQGAHLSKPAADCVLCEEIASRPKQPTAANVPSGLPEISAEDARWLSDNPNTEDILDWIRAYGEQCRIADCRAVVIDDAMVERASVAAVAHNASIYGYDPDQYFGINRQTCLDEARAALTAALGGLEGS